MRGGVSLFVAKASTMSRKKAARFLDFINN
jgi:hypothetical protein